MKKNYRVKNLTDRYGKIRFTTRCRQWTVSTCTTKVHVKGGEDEAE